MKLRTWAWSHGAWYSLNKLIILKCINSTLFWMLHQCAHPLDHNSTLLALAYTSKSLGNQSQSRQEGCKVRLQRIRIRRYVIDFLEGGIFFCRSLSFWRIKCKTLTVALCCQYQALFLGVQKFQDSSGEFWTAACTICSALHVWLLTEEQSVPAV